MNPQRCETMHPLHAPQEELSEDPSDLEHGIQWMVWHKRKYSADHESQHALIYSSLEILIFFFLVSSVSNFLCYKIYSFNVGFILYICGVILITLIRHETVRQVSLIITVGLGYTIPIILEREFPASVETFCFIPFLFLLTGLRFPILLCLAFNCLLTYFVVFYFSTVNYSNYRQYRASTSVVTLVLFLLHLVVGLIIYYQLLVISSALESIYRHPYIALRFIPDLETLERVAFSNLPVSFLVDCHQGITLDEQLFFFLRLFQYSEFRYVLLQFLHHKNHKVVEINKAHRQRQRGSALFCASPRINRSHSKALLGSSFKKHYGSGRTVNRHKTSRPRKTRHLHLHSRHGLHSYDPQDTKTTDETLKRYLREVVMQFFLETYPNKSLSHDLLGQRFSVVTTKYRETALASYNKYLERVQLTGHLGEHGLLPLRSSQLKVIQYGRSFSLLQLYPEAPCSDDRVSIVSASSYPCLFPDALLHQLKQCFFCNGTSHDFLLILSNYNKVKRNSGWNFFSVLVEPWRQLTGLLFRRPPGGATGASLLGPKKRVTWLSREMGQEKPSASVPASSLGVVAGSLATRALPTYGGDSSVPVVRYRRSNSCISTSLYFSTWILAKQFMFQNKKNGGTKRQHFHQRHAFQYPVTSFMIDASKSALYHRETESYCILKDLLSYNHLGSILQCTTHRNEMKRLRSMGRPKRVKRHFDTPQAIKMFLSQLNVSWTKVTCVAKTLWNMSFHLHHREWILFPHQTSNKGFSDTRIERWFLVWSCYLESVIVSKLRWTHYVLSFLQIALYLMSEVLYRSAGVDTSRSGSIVFGLDDGFIALTLVFHTLVVVYMMLYNKPKWRKRHHSCHLDKIRNLILGLVNLLVGEGHLYLTSCSVTDKTATNYAAWQQLLVMFSRLCKEVAMNLALLSFPLLCYTTERFARYLMMLMCFITFLLGPILGLLLDRWPTNTQVIRLDHFSLPSHIRHGILVATNLKNVTVQMILRQYYLFAPLIIFYFFFNKALQKAQRHLFCRTTLLYLTFLDALRPIQYAGSSRPKEKHISQAIKSHKTHLVTSTSKAVDFVDSPHDNFLQVTTAFPSMPSPVATK